MQYNISYSLLSDDNMLTCNLETLVATYHRYFSRQDNFRVGSAIVLLLRMRDLLPSSSQRLAALSLLHELYRSDSASSNPFGLFFVELLQPTMEGHTHAAALTERWFLSQILSPTLPREVSCMHQAVVVAVVAVVVVVAVCCCLVLLLFYFTWYFNYSFHRQLIRL